MVKNHEGKEVGGRPAGALNKPKKTNELLKQLEAAAEREGKKFTYTIDDGEVHTDNPEAAAAASAAARKQGFNNLDIILDNDEIDTFKCGVCSEILPYAVTPCPHCGAVLNW